MRCSAPLADKTMNGARMSKPTPEEQRLLAKIRAVSVAVIVGTMVFVIVAVVLLPLIQKDYALSEGTLVALLATLTTSALTLAGVARLKDG